MLHNGKEKSRYATVRFHALKSRSLFFMAIRRVAMNQYPFCLAPYQGDKLQLNSKNVHPGTSDLFSTCALFLCDKRGAIPLPSVCNHIGTALKGELGFSLVWGGRNPQNFFDLLQYL